MPAPAISSISSLPLPLWGTALLSLASAGVGAAAYALTIQNTYPGCQAFVHAVYAVGAVALFANATALLCAVLVLLHDTRRVGKCSSKTLCRVLVGASFALYCAQLFIFTPLVLREDCITLPTTPVSSLSPLSPAVETVHRPLPPYWLWIASAVVSGITCVIAFAIPSKSALQGVHPQGTGDAQPAATTNSSAAATPAQQQQTRHLRPTGAPSTRPHASHHGNGAPRNGASRGGFDGIGAIADPANAV
eukprot:TRINITY_DN70694_c0_g1_i1.p1 TRINITY_DN70694_c0_g1~~TRINITY_DN70694_c0_g1_i1.p1  ORF type:complete len:248 (-),score=9.90 TRINITY_DN70694_c0_g1_i1:182-925(-)